MIYPIVRQRLQSEFPDLWSALHPRTYSGAGSWCDAAVPAASLGSVCGANLDGFRDGPGSTSLLATGLLSRYRMPTYHVGRELAMSLSRTDPPPGMSWTEIDFPTPAGLFLLPVGTIKDTAGQSYNWVCWARVTPSEPIRIPGQWGQSLATPNDVLIFATASADDPKFGHLNLAYSAQDWPHARPPAELFDPHQDGQSLTEAEGDVMRRLASLAVGLILAMTARPQLAAETGRRVRTIKQGPAKEEWSPNWLGRTYAISRPQSGTHASPRLHWRRGHFRRQPVGEGRREIKTIWIEPVLVGE